MQQYSHLQLFYFSGTGNARQVATWIAEEAISEGITANITNISKDDKNIQLLRPDSLTGFISPTHGFNYPPVMIKFILRFPRAKTATSVFLMNTRAGMKVSKLFLPGLSGAALLFAALVLIAKGYKITGMSSIDLPSNWISLHPGLKQSVVTSIFDRCKRKTTGFTRTLLSGKRNYRALLDLPQDLLVAPVSILYYFIGRFIIAKTFIASSGCDNCGLCISQCPVKAITMVNKRPYWSYRCESCMRCMNNCPKRAIETAHGMLIATILIFNFGILYFLYRFLERIEWNVLLTNKGLKFVVENLLLFVVIITVYRAVHYLKRYRWFDWMVTYTSLTKYKFWRRYKVKGM